MIKKSSYNYFNSANGFKATKNDSRIMVSLCCKLDYITIPIVAYYRNTLELTTVISFLSQKIEQKISDDIKTMNNYTRFPTLYVK